MDDKYKCPSYYDDSNTLRDCTCSKCDNTPDTEIKHCLTCNQMTNHKGEKCLKHTPDNWNEDMERNEELMNMNTPDTEIEKCCICYEPARLKCSHCDVPYCDTHYGTTVMTGNCCSDNEKDYE